MQFTTVFTVLATAALAFGAAVPEPGKPNPYPTKKPSPPKPSPTSPSGGNNGGNGSNGSGNGGGNNGCQNGAAGACCTGFGQLFGLNCVLNILSNTCSIGSTACCPTNQNGLINIGSICIPITL